MPCSDERDDLRKHEGVIARLLKARTVLVSGPVDQELAEEIIAQLLVLDAESHDPIRVFVTSQGGHDLVGLGFFDPRVVGALGHKKRRLDPIGVKHR